MGEPVQGENVGMATETVEFMVDETTPEGAEFLRQLESLINCAACGNHFCDSLICP